MQDWALGSILRPSAEKTLLKGTAKKALLKKHC